MQELKLTVFSTESPRSKLEENMTEILNLFLFFVII